MSKAVSEFSLIATYFSHLTPIQEDQTVLGIGDDAAIINIPENHRLVSSVTQWRRDIDYSDAIQPNDLGVMLILSAVNQFTEQYQFPPTWLTLALTLNKPDTDWLSELSSGMATICQQQSLQLIGGDTTQGPECLRVVLMGAHL